jgi:hypothetical protein
MEEPELDQKGNEDEQGNEQQNQSCDNLGKSQLLRTSAIPSMARCVVEMERFGRHWKNAITDLG